jgi:cysteinyl-tRNA synthetase
MIVLVEKLLTSGHAYKADDGIYFKVSSFPTYGELSHQPIDDNSERDCALWKFETTEDNGNAWDASFGRGRPGWHIECSAMSMTELGEQLDIHTGGSDLLFPHHENEIAQSEAVTGKQPFVRHWIHNAFVNVDGQKMSKSLGNIYTLNNLLEHQISPLAYRFWLLMAHYSTPVNFTWEAVAGAQVAFNKIVNQVRSLGSDLGQINENSHGQFLTAIKKLNTPIAIALLINLLDSTLPAPEKLATALDFDRVLGLGLAELKPIEIPAEVTELAAKREEARQAQNWALADELRAQIATLGFQVNDSPSGPQISPI